MTGIRPCGLSTDVTIVLFWARTTLLSRSAVRTEAGRDRIILLDCMIQRMDVVTGTTVLESVVGKLSRDTQVKTERSSTSEEDG